MRIGFAATLVPFAAIPADGPRPTNAEIFFRLENPCPATGQVQGACTGYVVDRVIPTICGGADAPDNMKWLKLAEAKEKRKWERIGCRAGRKLVLPGQATLVIEAFAMKDVPEPVEAKPLSIGSGPSPIGSGQSPIARVPVAVEPEEIEKEEEEEEE